MTPPLAPTDVVESVRREVERTALRARNGLKYLSGAEWAPRAPTPSDVVWREGKAELRRYRGAHAPRIGPPVLAFLGLVSNASVFDLVEGNSFVRRLLDAGFDPFVLDWGAPDEVDAHNTVETYVDGQLPRAIAALLRETGADEVSLIGYCMGGDLALLALAGRPDLPVRCLVTMATPVDFRHMGPLVDALRDGRLEPESFLDETGNVPDNLVGRFFKVRRPTADAVQYANLWQHLWSDDYLEGHQAMGATCASRSPCPAPRSCRSSTRGCGATRSCRTRCGSTAGASRSARSGCRCSPCSASATTSSRRPRSSRSPGC